ncbi:unnamed protein product [Didymodactylos carnosus]|uniref:Uncharacterized protein n=1 Tax=Didymodactylos carnosus TaxID=1234261 RepID=A0A815GJE0_9BILA|nr:unnamed protein product [Didymodactylos carnosus]CAF4201265.1 unnamed protein product [Didymodactylos carnosus]
MTNGRVHVLSGPRVYMYSIDTYDQIKSVVVPSNSKSLRIDMMNNYYVSGGSNGIFVYNSVTNTSMTIPAMYPYYPSNGLLQTMDLRNSSSVLVPLSSNASSYMHNDNTVFVDASARLYDHPFALTTAIVITSNGQLLATYSTSRTISGKASKYKYYFLAASSASPLVIYEY